MTENDVWNWIAIYLLTFNLCVVAAVLAASTVGYELYREKFWTKFALKRDYAFFLPRVWWRWQKRYLLGTPAILAVVLFFALNLEWTTEYQ